ncbi:MAG: hypothetical protein ILP18_08640 [Treponema sp.]|nr:hypothetical protein [Treponema sp.]
MKNMPTYKQLDEMMESDFCLFVFILTDMQGILEDDQKTVEKQLYSDELAVLADTNAQIVEMLQDKEFFFGKSEEELIISMFERLPEKNRDSVSFAMDTFVKLIQANLEKTKGKHRKKQEDLLARCLYITELLYLLFNQIDSDTPYREAFSIGLDAAEEMLDTDLWKEDNEELWGKDCAENRRAFIKGLRDKLEQADKEEALEKTLCGILDGLGTDDRNYICCEVMDYAELDTLDKLDEMRGEYGGTEVDLSAYMNRAAAAKQMARNLRKKYAPPADNSDTEDTDTEE